MSESLLDHLLTSMRRRRLVFVQVTPLVDRALADSTRLDAFRIVAGDAIPTSLKDEALLFINPFDAVLEDVDPTRCLGRAREAVNDLLDAGHSICLVSRVPRMSFPSCPGSSLLEDAFVFHADSVLEPSSPAWTDPADQAELQASLDRLGSDVLACLDYLYFDLQSAGPASTSLISPLELEAIRGAGLVTIDVSGTTMSTALPLSALMPAIATSISNHLGVQSDFPHVASGLVEVERRIRRSLHRRAIAEFGEKWRGAVLGQDLAGKVEERATQELSRSATVKGLRNPFEWLTMGELVDLTRTARWAAKLGRDERYWQRFATELMPIRNRLSHMRFLRQQDRSKVEYWKASLARTIG